MVLLSREINESTFDELMRGLRKGLDFPGLLGSQFYPLPKGFLYTWDKNSTTLASKPGLFKRR